MEISSKIFKRKSGKSQGKWIVRVRYFNELDGRYEQKERHADKRTEAVDLRNKLEREIEQSNGQLAGGEKVTFAQLAAIAKDLLYKPAVIVEGRKLKNTVKGHTTAHGHLDLLSKFFGKRLIRQITKGHLIDYRDWRLKTGRQYPNAKTEEAKGGPLKLATINRELSTMRRVMRYAYEDRGWLLKPLSFKDAIDTDAGRPRTRLLSPDEEAALLNACQGERVVPYTRVRKGKTEVIEAVHSLDNPRLKAAILLALDGGLRRGEILKSEWSDFDFENNIVLIRGTNTKTETERIAPLTRRAKEELQRLHAIAPDEKPFPFSDFKRSWTTAKRLAGIEDLHFHDLRRCAVSKWIEGGLPLAFAAKVAGHAGEKVTSKHYVGVDMRTAQQLVEQLNAAHATAAEPALSSEFVS